MTGDIALAGFVMTADEWLALDDLTRAQLIAISLPREDRSVVASLVEALAAPSRPEASG